MPPSINRETNAYAREIWERAMQSERGIEIICNVREEATVLRQACYQIREYERKQSKSLYPPDHPKWGTSDWDAFRIVLKHQVNLNLFTLNVVPHAIPPIELNIRDL